MGYNYGDKRTAGTGVWYWLQGVRNGNKEGTNYIPKHLDINQRTNFLRDVVLAFYTAQGLTAAKKNWHRDVRLRRKVYGYIQDHFSAFTKYVKENYLPDGGGRIEKTTELPILAGEGTC